LQRKEGPGRAARPNRPDVTPQPNECGFAAAKGSDNT